MFFSKRKKEPQSTTPSATPELTAEQTQEIADFVLEGKEIHAIKRFREITGTDLLEAKRFIDSLKP